MPAAKNISTEAIVEAYKRYGSIRAAARHLGIHNSNVVRRLNKHGYPMPLASGVAAKDVGKLRKDGVPAEAPEPIVQGRVQAMKERDAPLPKKGVKRYLLTCAQNNTPVHDGLWHNLLALAKHYRAEIMVSRFTYDKASYKHNVLEKVGAARVTDYDDVYYADEVAPYLADERVALAPGLVWCGEMNILPTAVRPLSGFESYTGRHSGIFPHVKIAMESIASGKHEPTKFNYTTGTVTMRNYIQRKAGLKAEFHHCYGALLVEVCPDGSWYVRQVNGDSDGTVQDLDVVVKGGKVTTGNRVEAITWGDIHTIRLDKSVAALCWGEGGMLDTLRPRYQFMHDVFDFHSRNHHDRGNPHKMFEKHLTGTEDVRLELNKTGEFVLRAVRPWCQTKIVESNHDNALGRWLASDPGWYARDPINATVFLELQMEKYRMIERGERGPLLEPAIRLAGVRLPSHVQFLAEDESFIICRDQHGGIECGMHGHNGPNGARGTRANLAKMGRKSNIGHSHSAGITDGCYQTGTSSELDLGYNVGPSSWSHSHVLTYPSGKRCVLTLWNGRWKA